MSDRQSFGKDVLTAYGASAMRMLSWVIVLGVLKRQSDAAFANLGLIRGTLGILTYTALGLFPAMIQAFAHVREAEAVAPVTIPVPVTAPDGAFQLSYVTPQTTREQLARMKRQSGADQRTQSIYATGMMIALYSMFLGGAVTAGCAIFSESIYRIPSWFQHETKTLIIFLG